MMIRNIDILVRKTAIVDSTTPILDLKDEPQIIYGSIVELESPPLFVRTTEYEHNVIIQRWFLHLTKEPNNMQLDNLLFLGRKLINPNNKIEAIIQLNINGIIWFLQRRMNCTYLNMKKWLVNYLNSICGNIDNDMLTHRNIIIFPEFSLISDLGYWVRLLNHELPATQNIYLITYMNLDAPYFSSDQYFLRQPVYDLKDLEKLAAPSMVVRNMSKDKIESTHKYKTITNVKDYMTDLAYYLLRYTNQEYHVKVGYNYGEDTVIIGDTAFLYRNRLVPAYIKMVGCAYFGNVWRYIELFKTETDNVYLIVTLRSGSIQYLHMDLLLVLLSNFTLGQVGEQFA